MVIIRSTHFINLHFWTYLKKINHHCYLADSLWFQCTVFTSISSISQNENEWKSFLDLMSVFRCENTSDYGSIRFISGYLQVTFLVQTFDLITLNRKRTRQLLGGNNIILSVYKLWESTPFYSSPPPIPNPLPLPTDICLPCLKWTCCWNRPMLAHYFVEEG